MRATWSVYMIRCKDGTLYTGVALDVSRRLAEHRSGSARGAKYLRGKGPLRLVLRRAMGSKGLAFRVEHRIKRLPRSRKEELIRDRGAFGRLLRDIRSCG